jgi:hypothetical protein
MSGRRNKGELPDCQWQQRLWIKENKWKLCLLNPPVFQKNNVFFFKKKKKGGDGVEMFRASVGKTRWGSK